MSPKCGCKRPATFAICEACSTALHAAAEAKNAVVRENHGLTAEVVRLKKLLDREGRREGDILLNTNGTPLTTERVRELVEGAGKLWTVVIAGDALENGTTQFVTWGKTAEAKVYASDLSEYLGEHLCGPAPPKILESFHEKGEAARNKEELERLRAILDAPQTTLFADGHEPSQNERHLLNLLSWRQKEAADAKAERDELRAAASDARAERDACHALFDEAMRLCGYQPSGRPGIVEAVKAVIAERDKLQAFKDWVHAYLDAHGVPHHPPGPHGAEGCRIGDRMDWLWDRLGKAVSEVERLKKLLDRDHTGLAQALAACRRIVGSWFWIPAGEWGCYEYHERTEEALRAEVGHCFDEVEKVAETALRESGTRAGAAFVPERDKLAAVEAEIERLGRVLAARNAATTGVTPLAGKVDGTTLTKPATLP